MAKPTQTTAHLTNHRRSVNPEEREQANGHRGVIVWFTGFSNSGKSTLANKIDQILFQQGCKSIVLDGDNVRYGINSDLGFSRKDRKENIRRVGEVAKLFVSSGMITLTACISPTRTTVKR